MHAQELEYEYTGVVGITVCEYGEIRAYEITKKDAESLGILSTHRRESSERKQI